MKIHKQEIAKQDSNVSFHFLTGINRNVIPHHVTKIANSVQELGVTRPVVTVLTSCIDGVKRRYIIDAQHLFTALCRLGMDIPYITLHLDTKEAVVEAIALHNSSSKSWETINYVEAWKSLDGKEDYHVLYNAYIMHDLPLGLIAYCYSNKCGHDIASLVKKGNFKVVNKEKGDAVLKDFADLFKVIKNRATRFDVRTFAIAYVNWRYSIDKYNHKAFLEYIKKNLEEFKTIASTKESAQKVLEQFSN